MKNFNRVVNHTHLCDGGLKERRIFMENLSFKLLIKIL